jgi:hypothetical protein
MTLIDTFLANKILISYLLEYFWVITVLMFEVENKPIPFFLYKRAQVSMCNHMCQILPLLTLCAIKQIFLSSYLLNILKGDSDEP